MNCDSACQAHPVHTFGTCTLKIRVLSTLQLQQYARSSVNKTQVCISHTRPNDMSHSAACHALPYPG